VLRFVFTQTAKVMLMTRNFPVVFVLAAMMLWACDGGDTPSDGDLPLDGDSVVDGDVSPDGDEPADGDAPQDGDLVDGDVPTDGDVEPVDGDDSIDGDEPIDGDTSCEGIVVTEVSGRTVDTSGDPIQSAVALVCLWNPEDRAICLQPSMTDAQGTFIRDVPSSSQCADRAAVRLLNTVDLTWTQLACPLDLGDGESVDMGTGMLASVPEAASRDELGDAASPHVITAQGGSQLVVTPDKLLFYDGSYDDMRLMEWDGDVLGWPCFIGEANPPEALLALVPELEIKSAGAVHVRFPNTNDLDPGTTVTVYAMGGSGTHTWDDVTVEEGQWEPVGQGIVSENGSVITTEGGDGLPFYTWVGWVQE
jgi:hypothetical protein